MTRAAAGRSLQGALEGRGNWGRGVTPHSDPGKHASGSKSAQAARLLCAAQKVLARFTDLQAMCAGGCRGEPPCPPPAVTHPRPSYPRPALPSPFPLTRRPGRLVKSPAGNPPGRHAPTFLYLQPAFHPRTFLDQRPAVRLVKTPRRALKEVLTPLGGQKSPLARNSARKKLLTTTPKSPIIFSAHQVRIASRGRAVW